MPQNQKDRKAVAKMKLIPVAMVGSEGRRGARPGAGARPGGAFSHPAPRLPPPLRPERGQGGGERGDMEQGDVLASAKQERGVRKG